MWRGRSAARPARALLIVIGEDALAWTPCQRGGRPSGTWQRRALAADAMPQQMYQALASLAPQCVVRRVREVRVIVADIWLAAAVLPGHTQQLQSDQTEAWARAGLLRAGHPPAADDLLRWDDAAPQVPRLCVAYPAGLLQALAQCAQSLHARLGSVLPLSLVAWHGARGQADALLLAGRRSLLLAGGGGSGKSLRTLVLRHRTAPGQPCADDMPAFWARLRLRDAALCRTRRTALLSWHGAMPAESWNTQADSLLAADSDQALAWLGRIVPLAGSALDAIAPPAWWRSPWVATACGLVVLSAAMLWQAGRIHAENAAWQQRVARQVAAAQMQSARPAPEVRPERVQAINRAVAQLNLPVGQMLGALAPPPDIAVEVQQLEWSEPAAGQQVIPLRLVVTANNMAQLVRYAAALEQPPLLTGLQLRQHEVLADGRTWRFVLELAWRPAP